MPTQPLPYSCPQRGTVENDHITQTLSGGVGVGGKARRLMTT